MIFKKENASIISKEALVSRKISIGIFLMVRKATRPELGWLERSDARAEQGERVTRSLFKNDSPALPKFDTITVSPIT